MAGINFAGHPWPLLSIYAFRKTTFTSDESGRLKVYYSKYFDHSNRIGVLINTSGELIGINAALISSTGTYPDYSFAIPDGTEIKAVKKISHLMS